MAGVGGAGGRLFSSGIISVTTKETDRWRTPEEVLDCVRGVGPIGLDPFTESDNPVGARHIYTEEEDGLRAEWAGFGLVFANPPYSAGWLKKVARKVAAEAGAGCEIILLVPSDTSTRWHQSLRETARAYCAPAKRLRFLRPPGDGREATGDRRPSCVWYFGERPYLFCHAFQGMGFVRVIR